MAKAKLGSIISEISGSIGSTTFKPAPGGVVVGLRQQPRKSRTPLQYSHGQLLPALHHKWRTATQTRKDQWAAHALIMADTMGFTAGRKSSGMLCFFQHCLEQNYQLQTITTAIPMPYRLPALNNVSVVAGDSSGIDVTAHDSDYDTNHSIIFQACRTFKDYPVKPRNWKFVGTASVYAGEIYELYSGFYPVWGRPAIGEIIHIRCRLRTTYLDHRPWPSPWSYASTTVIDN